MYLTINELRKAYDEYYLGLAKEKGIGYCMAHCVGINVLDYDSVMEDIDNKEQMEILCAVFKFAYLKKDKESIPFICNHVLVYGGE